MKRTNLFKFIVLLALMLMGDFVANAYDFKMNGVYYSINGNEATVTVVAGYKSYTGDVTIPETVSFKGTNYTVTAIGIEAFWQCSGLMSVDIPNTVTSIGECAFYECTNLSSITIPNSVTLIGRAAFTGTGWYDNQPDGLVYAGQVAYKYKGTTTATSITLQDGTLGIASYAFSGCNRLTSMTIPESVKFVGSGVFCGCTNLTNITVEDGNTWLDSRDNCNAIIESASNTLVAGCKRTIIPNSVTSIGTSAFVECTGLTSIEIPNSVSSIGRSAFYGCGLSSIDIPNSVTTIERTAFSECKNLTSVTIPNSVTSIGACAFLNCTNLSGLSIPNSVTSIGSDAFYNTKWYNNKPNGIIYAGLVAYDYKGTMPSGVGYSLVIQDGTIGIAEDAFNSCWGLTSVVIPKSVTTITNNPFTHCTSLTSITVESGNQNYDSRDNCNAIIETASNTLITGCKGTVIPNSVTSIGRLAFCNNGNSSITIPNSVSSIGELAIYYCSNLESVIIGDNVTSIGNYFFIDHCDNLMGITCLATIPPSVGRVEVFPSQATLYVPSKSLSLYQSAEYWEDFSQIIGITMVGDFEVDGIYYHATSDSTAIVISNERIENYYIGDVIIPASVNYEGDSFSVTGIGDGAFEDCYELTNVVIGDAVETIGEEAFQGCTGLTSVTIGSGVTSIGTKAFNYCNGLQTVTCRGTVPPVMANTNCFSNAAYNHATLLVPRNCIETYQATNYWYKFAAIEGFGSAGMGDVNADGIINISDVTKLISVVLKKTGEYIADADLNNNGIMDIGDVTSLILMVLNQ